MALILNIETSTKNCSVALSRDGVVLAWRESEEGNDHAAKTAVFVEEVLSEAGRKAEELDAVAVGKGPGSYTGLRIGVSTAKGLAYGLGKPLIAVSPLQAMASETARRASAAGFRQDDAVFCSMTDAGRMEVYAALYDARGEELRPVEAVILDPDSYSEYWQERDMFFAGNACFKCQTVLASPRIHFCPDIHPSARYMPLLSEKAFQGKRFEDLAYFEPFYLKDFIAGRPHVKGLD